MRMIMENFAAKRDKDPLAPSTWYNLSTSDLQQEKVPERRGRIKMLANTYVRGERWF